MLSSQKAAWDSIYLESHRQPAYETPEYCYGWHVIGFHIGRPVTVEVRSGKRRFARKSLIDGDICIFPANNYQWERCHRETEFIDLHLKPTLVARTAYELVDADKVELAPRLALRDPLLQQIALALRVELQSASDRLYAESMAQALSIHLLRRYSARGVTITEPTGGLPEYKLRQAVDYIHEHLETDLSVEAIATNVQMSPYYFSRLFKQSTGLAPYQYIIQRRVDRAKQLLFQGEMAIVDIAYSVGFANQSHLTRHFKRLVGLTPKAFLQQ